MPTLIVILKSLSDGTLMAHGIQEDETLFGPVTFHDRPQLDRYLATYFSPQQPKSTLLAL